MGSTERRTVKARHDSKNSKFILTYEHIVEMDLADVAVKINEVKSYIAQMEFHAQRIEVDLQNARRELESLQGAYGPTAVDG